MTTKNEIIITELKFQVNNFKGTGKNYDIYVYAQDETESDMYTVDICGDEEKYEPFYVDSCGGLEGDVRLDEIQKFVVNFLFKPQLQTVIQGF